jgi:hypothetical protein
MSAIASSLTIPYISIIVLIVLGKMSLPITMLLSYYILDRRYCWTHYTGLGITLFGVTLSIVPYLFKDKDTQSSNPWAIAVYILSLIPGVLSYIYKEKFLKNSRNVNMWWMNSCISFWQFIIGIATIPFLFIPLTQININPSNFGDYISRGFNCQFNGEDFYNNDRCRFSLLWLLIYQLISTLANILIFLILKHGSSMVFMVLSTLKTPITGFLGYILISSNLLYTTEAQKVHIHLVDYFSLFLIIIGSIIYNIKPENSRPINELEQRLLSNDSELDDVIN